MGGTIEPPLGRHIYMALHRNDHVDGFATANRNLLTGGPEFETFGCLNHEAAGGRLYSVRSGDVEDSFQPARQPGVEDVGVRGPVQPAIRSLSGDPGWGGLPLSFLADRNPYGPHRLLPMQLAEGHL